MALGKSISIYAELLPNIRQVSVSASLAPSAGADASTRAEVFEQGHRLKVEHHGQVETLVLPSQVSVNGLLPIPQQNSQKLSWRLPLSPNYTRPSQFSAENQVVPWTSLDLEAKSPVSCRTCHHQIVQEGKIQVWKDLPSENWAEMMEFWHCHKPHDHEHEDSETLASKGYGANSTITSQKGVGFIDLTSFLVSESDCSGLTFSASTVNAGFNASTLALDNGTSTRFLHIFCTGCSKEIGLYNIQTSSVTLFKWMVTCQTRSPGRDPSSLECLAATLTATTSRSGSSKSIITPHVFRSQDHSDQDPVLYIWVLNPHVVYASSSIEGSKAAMKILYQHISTEQATKLAESLNSDVQELSLPKSAIQDAEERLGSSSLLLPMSERRLKEWSVGLLERWEAAP